MQRLWHPADLKACGAFELPNKLEGDDGKCTIEKSEWDYFIKKPPAVRVEDEAIARHLLRETAPKKVSLRTRFQRAVKRVIAISAFGGSLELDVDAKADDEVHEEWEKLQSGRTQESKDRAAHRQRQRKDLAAKHDGEAQQRLKSGVIRHNALTQIGKHHKRESDTKSIPLQRVERFGAMASKSGGAAFSDKSINSGLKAGMFDVGTRAEGS